MLGIISGGIHSLVPILNWFAVSSSYTTSHNYWAVVRTKTIDFIHNMLSASNMLRQYVLSLTILIIIIIYFYTLERVSSGVSDKPMRRRYLRLHSVFVLY